MSISILKHEVKIRRKLAKDIRKKTITSNPKITKKSNFVQYFSKALPHNKKGKVDSNEFKQLIKCLTLSSDFNKIHLGGETKLGDPQCIRSIELFGLYPGSYFLPTSPEYSSFETGYEMVELYGMALLRDVPFTEYSKAKCVKYLCKCLTKASLSMVTPLTLFRGPTEGDLKGLYISQFFLLPYTYGIERRVQKYSFYLPDMDYMTDSKTVISCQNGTPIERLVSPSNTLRYMQTLRDGASYCHKDFPSQPAMTCLNILLTLGIPRNKYNPYVNGKYKTSSAFVDFGIVDICNMIERVTRLAMLSCWQYKWANLRIRPEAFGIQIHQTLVDGKNPTSISENILSSEILRKIAYKYGSYYLPQAYPEGSPAHPSYPGGHAVLAGACITCVKAFFDCTGTIKEYVPSKDGQTLIETGKNVIINDELDKYATNIAMFRSAAGIHFRSDNIEGLLLGERIAIELLKEHVLRYPKDVKAGFILRKRNGKWIKILN